MSASRELEPAIAKACGRGAALLCRQDPGRGGRGEGEVAGIWS